MSAMTINDLPLFQIDAARGFLPAQDPLDHLPPRFAAWECVAGRISSLLVADKLRPALDHLEVLSPALLEDERLLQRAMLVLSVLGNAYIWGGEAPATRIPRSIAAPWTEVASRLGRPPIVSHASLVLYNWRLLDKSAPLDLDNLGALQLFLGGQDEEWFYLVTVALESRGAPAIKAVVEAQESVTTGDLDKLCLCLETIQSAIAVMLRTLLRMGERCDPYIFYHRVRPFLMGWPTPGVIYEGVSDTPQQLIGGSAAQSSLLQAIDAGLGIVHRATVTYPYLKEMRRYMPPKHRQFIAMIERGSSVRDFVVAHRQTHPELRDLYNQCISALGDFRKHHLGIARRYIAEQASESKNESGTGGTSFIGFLMKAREETEGHLIE